MLEMFNASEINYLSLDLNCYLRCKIIFRYEKCVCKSLINYCL